MEVFFCQGGSKAGVKKFCFLWKKGCTVSKFCYNALRCGEAMKKYASVKQKHLYNGQRKLMYEGQVAFYKEEEGSRICYMEKDGEASVELWAGCSELKLVRKSAGLVTTLLFDPCRTTAGSVLSEFGVIDLEICTHKYIKKDNIIAIEYDVLTNGEVSDGYRIIWNLKEELMS